MMPAYAFRAISIGSQKAAAWRMAGLKAHCEFANTRLPVRKPRLIARTLHDFHRHPGAEFSSEGDKRHGPFSPRLEESSQALRPILDTHSQRLRIGPRKGNGPVLESLFLPAIARATQ